MVEVLLTWNGLKCGVLGKVCGREVVLGVVKIGAMELHGRRDEERAGKLWETWEVTKEKVTGDGARCKMGKTRRYVKWPQS